MKTSRSLPCLAVLSFALLASCSSSETETEPAPGPQAVCCGCLCVDESWSCTESTCLTAEGRAVELVAEAGFFELAGGSFSSYDPIAQTSFTADSPRARVWYFFLPADEAPEDKPLVVLFNGGPGVSATGLFVSNTAPYTFDGDFTGGQPIADNPHSWSTFANLLYVDDPGSGFSYHLPTASGETPELVFDPWHDAGEFVRVITRFVVRHPQLLDNRVIVTGESYGGMRSAFIHTILLDYAALLAGGDYYDQALFDDVAEYYGAAFPGVDPSTIQPALVTERFGHQAMIQPFLTSYQHAPDRRPQPADLPYCLPDGDLADCDQPEDATIDAFNTMLTNMLTPEHLQTALLGSDATTVEWLRPAHRQGAYLRESNTWMPEGDESALVAALGELPPTDRYFIFYNLRTRRGYDGSSAPAPILNVPGASYWGDYSLRSMHDVETFITAARYDLVAFPPSVAPALADHQHILTSATVDTEPRDGIDRPGWIILEYRDDSPFGGGTRQVRNPPYEAGHSVSHRQPGELRADVQRWFESN